MISSTLRYSRQTTLPEFGSEGQSRLSASSVLVVGAGGLGCPVLSYLVAAGVGRILIVDPDLVDATNLHRQPLFGEADIGRLKAVRAAEVLRAQNPLISIEAHPVAVDSLNIRELFFGCDLVIDCTDNFPAKYLLNDACVELDLPLVYGSIFAFEGQCGVFNARIDEVKRGPTYRCLYPKLIDPKYVPSCAEAGVVGVLPGVVGTLQATLALNTLLGLGESPAGRLFFFDALNMTLTEHRFARNDAQVDLTTIRELSYYQNFSGACQLEGVDLTVEELRELLPRGEIELLDVREDHERKAFNIGGNWIPLAELSERSAEIPRNKMVVIYCHSGTRSAAAISMLIAKQSFTNLRNLRGGVVAWSQLDNNSNERDK